MLNKRRALNWLDWGNPISFNAPANPKPWSNPNENTTRIKFHIVATSEWRRFSLANKTIVPAIIASMGA